MDDRRDWRELYRDKRRLFVVLSIIVPFLAYCGYYYGMMVQNAPYRSDQFVYIEFKEFVHGHLREQLDTRAGKFTYYTKADSLTTKKVRFDHAALKELHFVMMDILFWNVRTISGDSTGRSSGAEPYLYYFKTVYERKTKVVWYQPHYYQDQKLDERMMQLVRTVRSMAISRIVK